MNDINITLLDAGEIVVTGVSVNTELKVNEFNIDIICNEIQQFDIEVGLQGPEGAKGSTGVGINYTWADTSLGIKLENENTYVFTELKGTKGDSLSFDSLTVQQKDELRGDVGSTETNYVNVFLNSLLG